MARPTKEIATKRLRNILEQIPNLKKLPYSSPEFKKWHRDTEVAIKNTFGEESSHVKDFNDIRFSVGIVVSGMPDSTFQRAYLGGLETSESVIMSMIDEIEEYWEDSKALSTTANSQEKNPTNSNKIFAIHGRDEATREVVARFLEKLELSPIILHEQPNKGRTIIEKFEDYSDVGFAVVLLTPDDVRSLSIDEIDLKPRARQNVILELGYFIGKLGREKVCPFVKDNVEVPSDYDGVVYTKFDDGGGWKTRLIQELKFAGFDIDANQAFRP